MSSQDNVDARSSERRHYSPSANASITENVPRGVVAVMLAGILVALALSVVAFVRSEAVERREADRAAVMAARMNDIQQRFDTRVNDIAMMVDARLSDAAMRADELQRDNRIMADDLRTIRIVLNQIGIPSSHEEVEEKTVATATVQRQAAGTADARR